MIREGSIKRSRDVGVVARDPGGGGAGARTHVTSAESVVVQKKKGWISKLHMTLATAVRY